MIDDFRLYERALSKNEIETIYRGDLEEEVILEEKIQWLVFIGEMKMQVKPMK